MLVHPYTPAAAATSFEISKLTCDELLSHFALKFNLRHYTQGIDVERFQVLEQDMKASLADLKAGIDAADDVPAQFVFANAWAVGARERFDIALIPRADFDEGIFSLVCGLPEIETLRSWDSESHGEFSLGSVRKGALATLGKAAKGHDFPAGEANRHLAVKGEELDTAFGLLGGMLMGTDVAADSLPRPLLEKFVEFATLVTPFYYNHEDHKDQGCVNAAGVGRDRLVFKLGARTSFSIKPRGGGPKVFFKQNALEMMSMSAGVRGEYEHANIFCSVQQLDDGRGVTGPVHISDRAPFPFESPNILA